MARISQTCVPHGMMAGTTVRPAEVNAMAKEEAVVLVEAIIESATPDRTQWKPYATTLAFDGKLRVQIPVPARYVVRKEKDNLVLSLDGWMYFLDRYTAAVEKMNGQWTTNIQTGRSRPYEP
jgi:hypothetical protein